MIDTKTLEAIVRNGQCYTNEARDMARELLERRAKDAQPPEAPSVVDLLTWPSLIP